MILSQVDSTPSPKGGILKKADIKKYIDEPLVTICESLFDKNIEIIDSQCNKTILNGNKSVLASLIINYKTLDADNRKLIDAWAENYPDVVVKKIEDFYDESNIKTTLSIPVNCNTKCEDITKQFSILTSQFNLQDCFFGTTTPDKILNRAQQHHSSSGYISNSPLIVSYCTDLGCPYDSDQHVFFKNTELFEKHLSYIEQSRKTFVKSRLIK